MANFSLLHLLILASLFWKWREFLIETSVSLQMRSEVKRISKITTKTNSLAERCSSVLKNWNHIFCQSNLFSKLTTAETNRRRVKICVDRYTWSTWTTRPLGWGPNFREVQFYFIVEIRSTVFHFHCMRPIERVCRYIIVSRTAIPCKNTSTRTPQKVTLTTSILLQLTAFLHVTQGKRKSV